jgi:hypothetical protein
MRFSASSRYGVTAHRILLRYILVFLILLSSFAASHAQSPDTQQSPYTLHVYKNLIQIPALVLRKRSDLMPPLSLQDFNISLDGGPVFHPTDIRREGNDPITLAIVFDISSDLTVRLPFLSKFIHSFAATSLRPQDHISLYSFNCNLVRFADDIPANSTQLPHDLHLALHSRTSYLSPDGKLVASSQKNCSQSLHLWDSLTRVAQAISGLPGRRVILVFTHGQDAGSTVSWPELSRFAAWNSIAIFAIRRAQWDDQYEDPLVNLTEDTGGIVLTAYEANLAGQLHQFDHFVRNRFILEFPRPDKNSSGAHNMRITVADAFVFPTGNAFSLPSAATLTNPTTVPTSPSQATYGSRHILPEPH